MYSGGPLLKNIKLQCIKHMYSDGPLVNKIKLQSIMLYVQWWPSNEKN